MVALRALTPPVGRGHKQYREEEALRAGVAAIEEEHRVAGLLTVAWQRKKSSGRAVTAVVAAVDRGGRSA